MQSLHINDLQALSSFDIDFSGERGIRTCLGILLIFSQLHGLSKLTHRVTHQFFLPFYGRKC
jgi:hypothetical protein